MLSCFKSILHLQKDYMEFRSLIIALKFRIYDICIIVITRLSPVGLRSLEGSRNMLFPFVPTHSDS